jgi:hypothetical protein
MALRFFLSGSCGPMNKQLFVMEPLHGPLRIFALFQANGCLGSAIDIQTVSAPHREIEQLPQELKRMALKNTMWKKVLVVILH